MKNVYIFTVQLTSLSSKHVLYIFLQWNNVGVIVSSALSKVSHAVFCQLLQFLHNYNIYIISADDGQSAKLEELGHFLGSAATVATAILIVNILLAVHWVSTETAEG